MPQSQGTLFPELKHARGKLLCFSHGNETPSIYHLYIEIDAQEEARRTFAALITNYCGHAKLLQLAARLEHVKEQQRRYRKDTSRITITYADERDGRKFYTIQCEGLRGPLRSWEISLKDLPNDTQKTNTAQQTPTPSC